MYLQAFRRVALLTFILLLNIILTSAQEINNGNQTGLPPFGSFHGSDFDVVSLVNGNLHIEIPFAKVPRRDGALTYEFVYDIPTWELDLFKTTTTSPVTGAINPSSSDGSGWRVPDPTNWGIRSATTDRTCTYLVSDGLGGTTNIVNDYQVRSQWAVIDPAGTKHPILLRYRTNVPAVPSNAIGGCEEGDPGPLQSTGYALDGSGIFVDITSINQPRIVLKDGTQIGPWTDSNGNHPLSTISTSGISAPSVNRTSDVYTVNDSNGNPQQYRVDFTPVAIQTSFCGLIPAVTFPGGCTEFSGTWYLPSKFNLPTGKFFQFTWAQNGHADLLRVDLPTGGSISYTYTGQSYVVGGKNNGSAPGCAVRNCGGQGTAFGSSTARYIRRQIASRAVTVAGVTSTWTYSIAPFGGGTVTDPLGNDEVHVAAPISVAAGDSLASYEQEVRFYKGPSSNGAILRTVDNDYAAESGPIDLDGYDYGLVNVRITGETTTLENGQKSRVETDFETSSFSGPTANYTFSRLNPTERREFDYGPAAPGPLVRKTDTTYLHTGNAAYQNLNIADRTASTIVYDGSGVMRSQTQHEYDNYTQPIQSTSATQHDAAFTSSYLTRGNLTATKRWRNTDGAFLTTRNQYDDVGNILSTTDPLGKTTQFDYSDAFASATCAPVSGTLQAFLKRTTNAAAQITSYTHNSCTGTTASITDPNGQTTTLVYDLMNRPTQSTQPDGGQIANCYTDIGGSICPQGPPPLSVVTAKKISLSPALSQTSTGIYDDLGRVSQTQLNSDPDGPTLGVTTYDPLSRISQVYNPTRCATPTTNCGESTWGINTTIYDALGRPCVVVPPDGTLPAGGTCPATQPANTIFTTYAGNTTTVTDQSGHSRKSVIDALGRLTQVFEDPAGQNLETDYTYDALGNLLTVNQKGGSTDSTQWRTRTFSYDSLSRLLTATNPESGTITYAYDADGNLVNKTSPAPNQTSAANTVTLTYCYDALNRLTAKGASFSPNPPQSCSSGTLSAPIATYSYDQPGCLLNTTCANIGHRTGMVDAAGAESWSYDVMGRPTTVQRTTNGFTRNFLYAYNFDGSLASLTYPSYSPLDAWPTRTETMFFTQGGAGRPLSEESSSTAAAYNAHYEPNGSLCFMNSDWGNLFTHTYTFNNRFQPATVQVYGTGHGPTTPCTASTDTTADLDLTYTYTDANGHNNGNVMQIEDNVEWSRTQDFAYDSLNRISAAWTWGTPANGAADCWAEQYGYDPWGNLLSISGIAPTYTGCSQESGFNVTVTAQNQVGNNVYDAAGNLISIPGVASYTYDAENHLLTAGGVTYTYDGDGQRIVKSSGTTYWYGAGSDPLFETDSSGYQIYLHYYFNGQRIGRREAWADGFWVDHYAYDALGNARFVYSFDGIDDESVYYPFGGERVIASGGKNQFKFTGKERDSESGLDNFGARYMGSSLGRFMSPDWSANPTPVPYASLPYPQSLNLYSYVQNNPLRFTDPTGHDPCTVDGEKHGSLWCWAHKHGWTETKAETAAREKKEARDAAELEAFLQEHPEYRPWNMVQGPVITLATMGAFAAGEAPGGGDDPTITPEQTAAIDAGAATGAEAGVARTMVNGVPQPNPNGEIVVGPNGTAIKIPAGYVAEAARNDNGIVYRPAGSTGDANTIRVMGADARQGARVIIYNSNSQPIVPSTGRTGSAAQTHVPLK